MKINDIKQLVRPACEAHGVDRLELFGSRAMGMASDGSDYDFLVTFTDKGPEGMADRFFGLLFYLEDHLNQPVDLLDRNALNNPFLKRAIERQKVPVYERSDC